jgi:AcrR family transcriptional regulator
VYDYLMGVNQSSNGRSQGRSPRVARRRRRMREALLTAGARQFASRGVAQVSVEDLLAEADVSRATFYAMFSSKYSLLESILNPIFETATAATVELQQVPALEGLSGILDNYLELWRTHREGLLLITTVDAATFLHFEDRHRALNDALYEVLTKAERAGLLRNGSAEFSLKVIARTAIPLLKVYDDHPSGDALFVDAMKALLIRSS